MVYCPSLESRSNPVPVFSIRLHGNVSGKKKKNPDTMYTSTLGMGFFTTVVLGCDTPRKIIIIFSLFFIASTPNAKYSSETSVINPLLEDLRKES